MQPRRMVVARIAMDGAQQIAAMQFAGQKGRVLADPNAGKAAGNCAKLAADFTRRIRFWVPRLELAHASFEHHEDHAPRASWRHRRGRSSWQEESSETKTEQLPPRQQSWRSARMIECHARPPSLRRAADCDPL